MTNHDVQGDWQHLKPYGYAPGNYMVRCHRCAKIADDVDKRAITCRPCAEARYVEVQAASAQPEQAQEAVAIPAGSEEFGDPRRAMTDDELQEFCIALSFEQDDYTEEVIRAVESRMLAKPLFFPRATDGDSAMLNGLTEAETSATASAAGLSSDPLGVPPSGSGSPLQPLASTAIPNAAARDVLAERQRQVDAEGWEPQRDDAYTRGQLAQAAACYALNAAVWAAHGNTVQREHYEDLSPMPERWPWARKWWKPTTERRDLVKAGALILAEIERLDRAKEKA
jgi:hypothetical protein